MKRLVRAAWSVFPFKPAAKRFLRSPAAPVHWLPEARAARILAFRYGHLRTIARNECVDAEGRPIPWYTYPALEFIRQLDKLSDADWDGMRAMIKAQNDKDRAGRTA